MKTLPHSLYFKTRHSAWALWGGMALSALVLAGCAGDGDSNGVNIQGVAATGAAMANASVVAKCTAGTASGKTAVNGSYALFVPNGAFPCAIEVSDGSRKLHSVANSSTLSAVAHATPLTEQLVGQLSADTAAFFDGYSATTAASLSPSTLKAAQDAVFASLAANGLAVPSSLTNLLEGALVAKTSAQAGNDYDQFLDTVAAKPVNVKMIALNDFHGNIEPTSETNGGSVVLPNGGSGQRVAVGGAAYLATVVKNLKAKNPNNIMVGAGDMVGASPFASSITHDEASIDVLNQIGLEVTSVGNHEFDHGIAELKRQQNGGCYPASGSVGVVGKDTCLIDGKFPGAKFKYLTANVVDTATGKPILAATYIKRFGTVSVGFIGLTLQGTSALVGSTGVAGLRFDEESATINQYAAQLKANGITAVVVLIHQGGQTTATTVNDKTCPGLSGDILPIMDKLSSNVDVVVSGHTHQEYVCNYAAKAAGKNILLTSTGFYGGAVSEIDLTLQPSKGMVASVANTVPVIRAAGSYTVATSNNTVIPTGFTAVARDTAIDALVTKYVAISKIAGSQAVGSITASITRAFLPNSTTRDETTEGAMGDLLADTYLAGVPGGADFALMNPGSVRADLVYTGTGTVTFSDLATIEPFGNTLVTLNLTGAQIVRLLEQQWESPNHTAKTNTATGAVGRLLLPSQGLTYTYDNNQPAGAASGQGNRIVAGTLKLRGVAIDPAKTYKIATNSFLGTGTGGDNFTVMATQGSNILDTKVLDLDAFIAYMGAHSPVSPPAARITRLN
ncbi:bifunctional metallophosphatase/5'-nucleotidase [Rhodoferax sp.]|uniref:bifunctional metallophosphatase/5'-nucleotidase n=1 Tax=Rhodoferax sp. TaxID=50421 RepID=UPI0026004A97|nr:bifunctional metallophosphatase/5'-nucleotidase [Rhodoferax sp.]